MGSSWSPRAGRSFRATWGWLAALAIAVTLAAWAPSARAADLLDPATGFRIPVDVHGARTCMVVPKLSTDRACTELKLSVLDEVLSRDAILFGAAALEREGRIVYIQATSEERRLWSAEDIRAYVADVEARMKAMGQVRIQGTEPGSRFELVEINGLQAVRFFVDLEIGPEPVRLRFVKHALPSGGRTVELSFFAVGADASELPLANGLLSAVTMRQSEVIAFGEPEKSQKARRIGALIGTFMTPVLFGLIALVVILWLRKRKERAAKRPPGPRQAP